MEFLDPESGFPIRIYKDRNPQGIARLSGQLLNEILRKGGFPDDLQVVAFHQHSTLDDTFEFVVSSKEFLSIPEGNPIPWVAPREHK